MLDNGIALLEFAINHCSLHISEKSGKPITVILSASGGERLLSHVGYTLMI